MFLKNDIYTSSGALKLYHCWNEKVTKYDSSSFYNWEQDNLPIYDLEERTYYLWEQFGYPSSSIPGVALVVSADASDNNIACNKNIFRSVSSLVEAIPKIINFPILVEIANFGQLGELKLGNLKFGPRGSLEIINRNFTKPIPSFSPQSISPIIPTTSGILDGNSDFYKYRFVSGVSGLGYIPGLNSQVNSDFGPRGQLFDTSCLSISSTVFSGVTDIRLSANGGTLNGFISTPSLYAMSRSTLFTANNGISPYGESNAYTKRVLSFKPYERAANASDEISTKDVSTIDFFGTNRHLYYSETDFAYGTPNTNATSERNALIYGNRIKKILITNCDGPIYIRNFFVDGEGSNGVGNDYGVEVNNCPRVYLENIVSTRHRRAGFFFNNSTVVLTRGCVANRNYEFNPDNSTRLVSPWNSRILQTASGLSEDTGAGLLANNSNIFVSSTSSVEYANIKQAVYDKCIAEGQNSAFAAAVRDAVSVYPSYYSMFEFSRNSVGIILNNSTFEGGLGDRVIGSTAITPFSNINIVIEGNTFDGIRTKNSNFSWSGRLFCNENMNGIFSESSVINLDKIVVGLNQRTGFNLINSTVRYNKDKTPVVYLADRNNHYVFSGNGQHIVMSNSIVYPTECSSMPNVYGRMKFLNPIGLGYNTALSFNEKGMKPSVELQNNSQLILVHPSFERTSVNSLSNNACEGSEISVNSSSKVVLKGSKEYATKLFGPTTLDKTYGLAAIAATENSTIEINGPTVIGQYGVDLYAKNKSSININPHLITGGGLDISGFNLADRLNHTAVELHSIRSCIVVDKESSLNVKDLGSFNISYPRTTFGAGVISRTANYPTLPDVYVSAGSLQFYPNPNDPQWYPAYAVYNLDLGSTNRSVTSFAWNSSDSKLYFLPPNGAGFATNDYKDYTYGGTCVKALNNSIVNLDNVNFPCGWWNSSGIIYDIKSASLCDQLFIWNIADDSKLRGSLLSVSGLHPRSAGYVGPSGDWGNSGLPSTTPDTSTISVLDYFGKTTRNPFGESASASNFGPFRLYFGVNAATKVLQHINVADANQKPVYQIYSQGYQPSSSLSALSLYGDYKDVSTLYKTLLNRQTNSTISASGYYYGSGMVDSPNTIKCFLDESAAETFANAKHCSVGKSGLSKVCLIYYSDTKKSGDGYNGDGTGIISVNEFNLEKQN